MGSMMITARLNWSVFVEVLCLSKLKKKKITVETLMKKPLTASSKYAYHRPPLGNSISASLSASLHLCRWFLLQNRRQGPQCFLWTNNHTSFTSCSRLPSQSSRQENQRVQNMQQHWGVELVHRTDCVLMTSENSRQERCLIRLFH